MSTVRFKVGYDGPALVSGTMQVRDLAPALLALSDLIDDANRQIQGGDEPRVSLRFRAVERGSFEVELALQYGVVDALIELLSGDTATALAQLLTFLGVGYGSGKGLLHLIKWVRSRKVTKVTVLEQHKMVEVTVEDGEVTEVSQTVFELYRNPKIRKDAFEMLRPLETDGIETFKAGIEEKQGIQVSKDEVKHFKPTAHEEVLRDETRRIPITIDNLAFKEGNKWRVYDGASSFFVTITDDAFLTRVKSGESFSSTDVLVVDLHTRTVQTVDGLQTDHEIVRVHSHSSGPPRLPFPTESDQPAGKPKDPTRPSDHSSSKDDV